MPNKNEKEDENELSPLLVGLFDEPMYSPASKQTRDNFCTNNSSSGRNIFNLQANTVSPRVLPGETISTHNPDNNIDIGFNYPKCTARESLHSSTQDTLQLLISLDQLEDSTADVENKSKCKETPIESNVGCIISDNHVKSTSTNSSHLPNVVFPSSPYSTDLDSNLKPSPTVSYSDLNPSSVEDNAVLLALDETFDQREIDDTNFQLISHSTPSSSSSSINKLFSSLCNRTNVSARISTSTCKTNDISTDFEEGPPSPVFQQKLKRRIDFSQGIDEDNLDDELFEEYTRKDGDNAELCTLDTSSVSNKSSLNKKILINDNVQSSNCFTEVNDNASIKSVPLDNSPESLKGKHKSTVNTLFKPPLTPPRLSKDITYPTTPKLTQDTGKSTTSTSTSTTSKTTPTSSKTASATSSSQQQAAVIADAYKSPTRLTFAERIRARLRRPPADSFGKETNSNSPGPVTTLSRSIDSLRQDLIADALEANRKDNEVSKGSFYGLPDSVQKLFAEHRRITTLYGTLLMNVLV